MAPFNGPPFVHEIALYPAYDFTAQPYYVLTGIITACCFSLGVCGSADIDDMDEGIGVSQIVQKSVSQSLAFMSARNKTSYIEQFNGHRTLAINTGAVIWFASVGCADASAGA